MRTEKDEYRRLYKAKRKSLSDKELEEASLLIFKNSTEWLKDQKFHSVHIFLPIKKQREVNTFPIVEFFWRAGVLLYTSMVQVSTNTLQTITVPKNVEFVEDKWGIPLPVEFDLIEKPEIDLIFIPLLAYDESGARLGFGKGYYDKFLYELSYEPIKLGLSFFGPEKELPKEAHDIPLDFCINPQKVLTF
jgi:5-formyltetrahydrofolate cyclo-ligase